jgi:hypothetical protein
MRFISLGLLYSVGATGMHAQAPQQGTIIPGKSLAGLKLGSTFSDFSALFPKHPDVDEDFMRSTQDDCPDRSYHWVDIDRDATGVYALFRGTIIYQLAIQTPRFKLENGIGMDTAADDVERTYTAGKEYILRGSGSEVVGGKDLLYWVDKADGIAFELYWNKHKRLRQISAITIFDKGSDYKPDGCISPPQQWQAINKTK